MGAGAAVNQQSSPEEIADAVVATYGDEFTPYKDSLIAKQVNAGLISATDETALLEMMNELNIDPQHADKLKTAAAEFKSSLGDEAAQIAMAWEYIKDGNGTSTSVVPTTDKVVHNGKATCHPANELEDKLRKAYADVNIAGSRNPDDINCDEEFVLEIAQSSWSSIYLSNFLENLSENKNPVEDKPLVAFYEVSKYRTIQSLAKEIQSRRDTTIANLQNRMY